MSVGYLNEDGIVDYSSTRGFPQGSRLITRPASG